MAVKPSCYLSHLKDYLKIGVVLLGLVIEFNLVYKISTKYLFSGNM